VLYSNLSKSLPLHSSLAIYGTGEAARIAGDILGKDYTIEGFLGRDDAQNGRQIYGHTILSMDLAVHKKITAIIIAANVQYWNTIYARIKKSADLHNITVFYTNGIAARLPDREEIQQNDYWNISIKDLEKACEEHGIVSFDIFDTLVFRKTADPTDVFRIIADRIQEPALRASFPVARRNAELRCRTKFGPGLYNIFQIYDELVLGCNFLENIDYVIKLELETEVSIIEPRNEMVQLFHSLCTRGKRVLLISDMYLDQNNLEPILAKCGIQNYEKIFVSCEQGASKETGALWNIVSTYLKSKKFLHIGDNPNADIEKASAAGADTFYILSPDRMLKYSTINGIVEAEDNIGNSMALGFLYSKLFNDPFSLHNSKGKPLIQKAEILGYCFFGPLVVCFMDWLKTQIENDKPEVILFTARDGYFFRALYKKLITSHIIEGPPGVYFKTSRRAVTVVSFRTVEDILDSLCLTYTGSSDVFFRNRLGIEPPIPDRHISTSDPDIIDIVIDNADFILENAEAERRRYELYLSAILPQKGKIALFDSGSNGSIQYFLQKIIRRNIAGYYMFYVDKSGLFAKSGKMDAKALYLESSDTSFNLLQNTTAICEAVFTEPEGTYLCIQENGEFKTDINAANYDRFPIIQKIHKGIEQYFFDYRSFSGNRYATGKEYAAKMINMIPNVNLVPEISASLCFEDTFRSSSKKQAPVLA
jgi:predicted HAD superfamily hydrolase